MTANHTWAFDPRRLGALLSRGQNTAWPSSRCAAALGVEQRFADPARPSRAPILDRALSTYLYVSQVHRILITVALLLIGTQSYANESESCERFEYRDTKGQLVGENALRPAMAQEKLSSREFLAKYKEYKMRAIDAGAKTLTVKPPGYAGSWDQNQAERGASEYRSGRERDLAIELAQMKPLVDCIERSSPSQTHQRSGTSGEAPDARTAGFKHGSRYESDGSGGLKYIAYVQNDGLVVLACDIRLKGTIWNRSGGANSVQNGYSDRRRVVVYPGREGVAGFSSVVANSGSYEVTCNKQ